DRDVHRSDRFTGRVVYLRASMGPPYPRRLGTLCARRRRTSVPASQEARQRVRGRYLDASARAGASGCSGPSGSKALSLGSTPRPDLAVLGAHASRVNDETHGRSPGTAHVLRQRTSQKQWAYSPRRSPFAASRRSGVSARSSSVVSSGGQGERSSAFTTGAATFTTPSARRSANVSSGSKYRIP